MSPLPAETNPETVAWTSGSALSILEDQQRRSESLQLRAGQIAGFAGATVALGAPLAGDALGQLEGVGIVIAAAAYFAGITCLALTIALSVLLVMKPRMHYGIDASEIKRYATEAQFMTEAPAAIQVRTMKTIHKIVRRYEVNNKAKASWLTRCAVLFLSGLLLTIVVAVTLAMEKL